VAVTHNYNISNLGGRDREDQGLRPVQANTIPETPPTKQTGGVDQAVKCLLCKCEVLSSNPSSTKKKKNHPEPTISKRIYTNFFVTSETGSECIQDVLELASDSQVLGLQVVYRTSYTSFIDFKCKSAAISFLFIKMITNYKKTIQIFQIKMYLAHK
jgi:hypothetical protein